MPRRDSSRRLPRRNTTPGQSASAGPPPDASARAQAEFAEVHRCRTPAEAGEFFKKRRPFNTDVTVKPVCKTNANVDDYGYPSGHATTGYLEALTLIPIVPEKRGEILAAGRRLRPRQTRKALGLLVEQAFGLFMGPKVPGLTQA